jgi:prepilin-type N-terminal cleavage/methylation domain-containing protein
MRDSRGFTLIELLIALLIFSIISAGALASLNHLMRSREQQIAHHQANENLDLAYAHLMQDMIWFVGEISAEQHAFQFLRTQTSIGESTARVEYIIRDGQLFRQGAVILNQVNDLTLSWLLEDRQWVSVFDQAQLESQPLLLRVQFTTPHLGEVTWIFSMPDL